MMFGDGGAYLYLECGHCGCLQLRSPIDDPARHYAGGYYTARPPARSRARALAKGLWFRHGLGRSNLPGMLLTLVLGRPPLVDWVRRTGVGPDGSILDVGCGTGSKLLDFRDAGFTQLAGIDPHLSEGVERDGLWLRQATLDAVEGSWDLVMLHHVFEHLPEPQRALRRVRDLLTPGGRVLLRTPLADSWAWRTYGVDWVQIDAPRHLFVHTRASLGLLARRAGLEVYDLVHDSNAMQFWGSEQYRQGIPLCDRSHRHGPRRSVFSRRQTAAFESAARRLNEVGDGDQACVYLRPMGDASADG